MRNAGILVRWIFYLVLIAILWRISERYDQDRAEHAMTASIHQEWQDWRDYVRTAVPYVRMVGMQTKDQIDSLEDLRRKDATNVRKNKRRH